MLADKLVSKPHASWVIETRGAGISLGVSCGFFAKETCKGRIFYVKGNVLDIILGFGAVIEARSGSCI